MRKLAVAGLVAWILTGCASTPAADDPTQVKLNDLDTRLTRIERVMSNQSLVDLAQRVDSLESEERQLQGRIDELENANQSLLKQLNGRGSGGAGAGANGAIPNGGPNGFASSTSGAAGSAGPAGTGDSAAAGAAASPPAPTRSVDQTVYQQAFDALKAGSYSIAITGFKDFLVNYPTSPLAENAQYWLGEAYYVNHDYDSAATAFRGVLTKYPNARKAPDALLKLGYTQSEMKKFADARDSLTQVTQKYPNTDAAKLATDKLKTLPAGGQ